MSIYNRTDYRRIYRERYGEIPRDNTGRVYDIHHIDGNRNNNNPNNLVAVSIQEHYDIHYAQGDWGACHKIGLRMKLSPNELSSIATKSNLERVANGTHPWAGGDFSRKRVNEGTHNFLGVSNPVHQKIKDGTFHMFRSYNHQRKLVDEGKHHWLSGEVQRKQQLDKVAKGTHHFIGGEIQRSTTLRRLAEGTHPWLDRERTRQNVLKTIAEGRHPSQIKITCEHCGKTASIGMYKRWHGDNCKYDK